MFFSDAVIRLERSECSWYGYEKEIHQSIEYTQRCTMYSFQTAQREYTQEIFVGKGEGQPAIYKKDLYWLSY